MFNTCGLGGNFNIKLNVQVNGSNKSQLLGGSLAGHRGPLTRVRFWPMGRPTGNRLDLARYPAYYVAALLRLNN